MKYSLKEKAYAHIRSRLANGILRPGDQLSHRAIASEIGISYTPVREAISQLATEGLLECHPRRGAYVSVPSREDVLELYDLRAAIETHVAGRIVGRLSGEELTELRGYNEELRSIIEEVRDSNADSWNPQQTQRWMLTDSAIHMTLLCAAGNRRAMKVVSDLQLMAFTFGHQDRQPRLGDLEAACNTHDALFDALEKEDGRAAQEIMREHLLNAGRLAVEAYDRGEWEEVERTAPGLDYPRQVKDRIMRIDPGLL